MVNGFKDVNKKVDYVLALDLTHKEKLALQSDMTEYRVLGGASINQTQGWTAFKPMFQCTEVKVDAYDPMIQLGVWSSAEFEKRMQEGYAMDLPIPVIAIEGDHWNFWIAYSENIEAKKGGKGYRVQLAGPVAMGDTTNAFGVFKILHTLKAIVRWGLEVYDPFFQTNVLARFE